MLQPHFLHQDGGFFAADAAGAETHHGFVLQLGFVRLQRGGKFGELGDAPVNGAFEGAVVHLEVVAGVQRDHRAAVVVHTLLQPAPHGGRGNGRGAAVGGTDGGVVHSDDFTLHLDQHLAKRLAGRPAFLGGDVGKPCVMVQLRHKAAHRVGRPGEEQVDAFFGQQNGAFEGQRLGARLQQYTQVLCVGQGDKLVRGNVQDGVHGGHFKGGTGTGYTR